MFLEIPYFFDCKPRLNFFNQDFAVYFRGRLTNEGDLHFPTKKSL